MANFPSSAPSFGSKSAGQSIEASHINDLQGEVEAIGTYLLSNSTTPRTSVYNNGTQSIASGSFVALTFDSEEYDIGPMHDAVTNTSRVTIPSGQAGLYLVSGYVYFSNINAAIFATIYKNGGEVRGVRVSAKGNGSEDFALSVTTHLSVSAGDYIELRAQQNTGGAASVGSATTGVSNRLSVTRIW